MASVLFRSATVEDYRLAMLTDRAETLRREANEQAQTTAVLNGRVGILQDRWAELRRQNDAALKQIAISSAQCEALSREADNLRLLAGGSVGVVTGVTIGIGTGASGGTLAACGVGGAVLGGGAAYMYNQSMRK